MWGPVQGPGQYSQKAVLAAGVPYARFWKPGGTRRSDLSLLLKSTSCGSQLSIESLS